MNPRAAIGITSLAEGVVSLVGLVSYFLALGQAQWRLGLALLAGSIASTPLSAWTVAKVEQRRLRVLAGLGSCALGLLVLLRLAAA